MEQMDNVKESTSIDPLISRYLTPATTQELAYLVFEHRIQQASSHVTTVPHSASQAVLNVQSSHTFAEVSSRGSGVKRR